MSGARHGALTVLERCRRAGAWSDALLGSVLEQEHLSGPDRALATALCYGVQQNRLLLDYTLASRSERGLNRVEPKVLDILRISACQLMFFTKIPASAAVNEGVKLCRELGYARAAGYVNAVLRRVAADPAVPKELEGRGAEHLSVRYSHPLWLVNYLLERLDPAEAETLLLGNNCPVPLCLRVNTLRTDASGLKRSLEAEGIKAEIHPFLPYCMAAYAPGDLSKSAAFRAGLFYIQDPGAAFAVAAAEPGPGQMILDLCAAPGGKSFAAALLSGAGAEITACDLHPNKLRRLREGAERLGLSGCISAVAGDSREERPEWIGRFDLVLADVPCSGLGVIRKKPDLRWKDPGEFDRLPELQLRLIEAAGRCTKPGGTLLYSTCTFREEENGAVVAAFLEGNPGFSPVEFSTPWGDRSEKGMLQLWTTRQDTDCFFIAKLRKDH